MTVRTSGRTPVLLLAFFILLGALAAEAAVSPDPDVGASASPVSHSNAPAPHVHPFLSPTPHVQLTLSGGATAAGAPVKGSPAPTSPPRSVGRPDIGPLPFDHFEHSPMLWNGHHALLVPRALPRGAILYHGSSQFDMSALGTRPLWLSPQSSAALAAAVNKHAQPSGDDAPGNRVAGGQCPEDLTIQLFEFVVATDALNMVYLPHSSLKVQEALNFYTTGTAGSPFLAVTMGQPSTGLGPALDEFCKLHADVRPPLTFFGWRSPFDQDEVMLCPWRLGIPMSPHVQSATFHRRAQLGLGAILVPNPPVHVDAPGSVKRPALPDTAAAAPSGPRAPHDPTNPVDSATGHDQSSPLVLRRQFSCSVERIRQLLELAARAGIRPNARGESFKDCKKILEATFNFDQVNNPSLPSMSSTGSRNWGALSSFHMQLADGLSIAQLLTPLVAGEEPPCSVHPGEDRRADIDQSLEPFYTSGRTEPF